MSEQKINPNQVTKPIQLLAAWLVGLILINGSFLSAAKVIESPEWASGFLVVAAVLNVPAFLILIFFLQTKFRAELQEDTFYSKHLEKVTGMYKDTGDIHLIEAKIRKENNDRVISLVNAVEKLLISLPNDIGSESGSISTHNKFIELKGTTADEENGNYKNIAKVALNDLMPNYKDALSSLLRAGYTVVQVFGSNSKDKKPPQNLTITYRNDVPKKALRELYELFKPYGFNRIDLDQNTRPNFFDLPNIYIGSYVDDYSDEHKSIEVNEALEALLMDDEITGAQFNEFVSSITVQTSA
ncbi:hypothetical protein R2E40_21095 [Aeromonas sp. CD]|uniref:hypothetical protein n=1 Tax=Aeromonas sp. CD TaxID=3080830 RepID=UPI002966EF4A|nr:hypothetical protein [Aeromonas sp. CD]WOX52218.1 hypothetical protein R2E40_21095 [Aeromonas sp. CD]